MAEPFAKPTKEQVKKLLDFTGDSLGFFLMGCAIKAMERINVEDFDVNELRLREWEFLTRRLLWKFGLYLIVENVYKLYETNAEEYWANWTPPKIKKRKNKIISAKWRSG